MIIGIMGAMPDEVDQLCAKLEQVTKETYAGVEYHQGMLNGRQVVVCCAGMGKANAASTVQVLITKYGAEKIIFSGIAGNMTSKIGIGDVCVGETVVYHDAQNDMIAQSAPFTAEYHGDPALVKAALDACNACGVKAIAGKIATGDLFCWRCRHQKGYRGQMPARLRGDGRRCCKPGCRPQRRTLRHPARHERQRGRERL